MEIFWNIITLGASLSSLFLLNQPIKKIAFWGTLVFGLELLMFIYVPQNCIIVFALVCFVFLVTLLSVNFLLFTNLDKHYGKVSGSYDKTFYSQKKILVLIPHQDDELNLVTGIIEKYIIADSEVHIVFSTNGDAFGQKIGSLRLNEAIKVCRRYGIPERNITFLGYADGWKEKSIYNSSPDEICIGKSGGTESYGLPNHPEFHFLHTNKHAKYTINNYMIDLEMVIQSIRADVIYCIDVDFHSDHRILSIFFERTMANILRKCEGYHPLVYKGCGYYTAWYSKDDYYSLNINKVEDFQNKKYINGNPICSWNSRIRLPVDYSILGNTKRSSSSYDKFIQYRTQSAEFYMGSIINSDKVFWERYTTAIHYNTKISVTSGNGTYLNDFCSIDYIDINDRNLPPTINAWIPVKEDNVAEARLIFDSPMLIRVCVLYSYSQDMKPIRGELILDKKILSIECINPEGTMVILQDEEYVSEVIIRLPDADGYIGLYEVEVYKDIPTATPFIKITDKNDNFIYRYLSSTDETRLHMYGYGISIDYSSIIVTASSNAMIIIDEQGILVNSVSNQTRVRVSLKEDSTIYDEILIIKCNDKDIWIRNALQKLEILIDRYFRRLNKLNSYFLRQGEIK